VPITGSEQVILGDLSILADGAPVEVTRGSEETKASVSTATPAPGRPAPDTDADGLARLR
jgi:hypothetical protein